MDSNQLCSRSYVDANKLSIYTRSLILFFSPLPFSADSFARLACGPISFSAILLFFSLLFELQLNSQYITSSTERPLFSMSMCVKQPLNWFEFGRFCVHSQPLEQPHKEAETKKTNHTRQQTTTKTTAPCNFSIKCHFQMYLLERACESIRYRVYV